MLARQPQVLCSLEPGLCSLPAHAAMASRKRGASTTPRPPPPPPPQKRSRAGTASQVQESVAESGVGSAAGSQTTAVALTELPGWKIQFHDAFLESFLQRGGLEYKELESDTEAEKAMVGLASLGHQQLGLLLRNEIVPVRKRAGRRAVREFNKLTRDGRLSCLGEELVAVYDTESAPQEEKEAEVFGNDFHGHGEVRPEASRNEHEHLCICTVDA